MAYINKDGYLERQTRPGKNNHAHATKRDWWLPLDFGTHLRVDLGKHIRIPKEYWGKRVKFKLEIIGDEKDTDADGQRI